MVLKFHRARIRSDDSLGLVFLLIELYNEAKVGRIQTFVMGFKRRDYEVEEVGWVIELIRPVYKDYAILTRPRVPRQLMNANVK